MGIFSRRALCHVVFMSVIGLWSLSSSAGVTLAATRLVISDNRDGGGGSGSIGVQSSASSIRPYLVRSQVSSDIEGKETQVPFVVSPALFRLEPGNTNQVRVVKTGGALPSDKESLFYLNVAALPASPTSTQTEFSAPEGALNVATGNIIKVFYRPNKLPVTQKEAMGQLQFTAVGRQLKVTNPTPYYITLGSLTVNDKPVNIRKSREQNMIAPYGSTLFAEAPLTGSIRWQTINDYGGREDFYGSVH